MEYLVEWERGPILGSTRPWYTTLGTPPPCHSRPPPVHASAVADTRCAMGSIMALRNSQKDLQVILEQTIWLLAPNLAPCCKNQLESKAPDYLALSIP